MTLSIIVLNWNTKELLKQCLDSLVSSIQYPVFSMEIIIVDNGSTDGSQEMIRKYIIQNTKYKIRLIENKENLGFAKGNNIGIKQAKGDYIMLLNSDTIVKEGAIEKMVEFLDENSGVVGVSPLILNEDGTIQKDPCYLRLPSPLMVLIYYNPILRKLFLKYLLSTNEFTKLSSIAQLSGAAMMVRGEVLNKISGFDESFPHFFEDTDISLRLKKFGNFVLLPEAKIVHYGGKSLQLVLNKEGIEKRYYLNFYGLFLFCRKHYSESANKLIRAIVFIQLFLTGKFSLIKKLK